MKDNYTHLICILDRSGSMAPVATDAIGGFNQWLAEQQKLPGTASLTLNLFNHTEQRRHYADIQTVRPLNAETYVPDGFTALLDAVGGTIDYVGKLFTDKPETERPQGVLCMILTDGHENHSKEYTLATVKEKIEHQRAHYNWEFVFLGVGLEQFAVEKFTSQIGIAAGMVGTYTTSDPASNRAAWQSLGNATQSFRGSGIITPDWQVPVPDSTADAANVKPDSVTDEEWEKLRTTGRVPAP